MNEFKRLHLIPKMKN